MLEQALSYGCFVLPLHNPLDGRCSCRMECSHIGKHPRIAKGWHAASKEPAIVSNWWRRWPEANIGLVCQKNGVFVLDVDPRHGGDETLAKLQAEYGPLPVTKKV